MIGKITIGKSFNGCLKYCLNDKLQDQNQPQLMKDRAEILHFNQCYGNQKELIQQFNEVRQLNSRLSKPVLHITLSLAPGEELPKEKLIEICQDCAIDMGFENNQYVAIRHKDTSHQHIHIVANRIGFDKRTVSDSNNFQKMAAYCRKMELKFNLTKVLSPRKFLPKEQRQIPRQDERKEKLKNSIQVTLKQVSNYHQFEQAMKALGYRVLKARGISFIDDKRVKIKGSEVGFSLLKIEKILALKKNPENMIKHPDFPQPESQKQGGNTDKNAPSSPQQLVSGKQSQSFVIDLQKKATDLISQLIEPEKIVDHLSPELLKKRRKKKRQRPHL
jgi:hypothetical protein